MTYEEARIQCMELQEGNEDQIFVITKEIHPGESTGTIFVYPTNTELEDIIYALGMGSAAKRYQPTAKQLEEEHKVINLTRSEHMDAVWPKIEKLMEVEG